MGSSCRRTSRVRLPVLPYPYKYASGTLLMSPAHVRMTSNVVGTRPEEYINRGYNRGNNTHLRNNIIPAIIALARRRRRRQRTRHVNARIQEHTRCRRHPPRRRSAGSTRRRERSLCRVRRLNDHRPRRRHTRGTTAKGLRRDGGHRRRRTECKWAGKSISAQPVAGGRSG